MIVSTVFLSDPVTLLYPVRLYVSPLTAAEWNVISSGFIEEESVLIGSEKVRITVPSLMLKVPNETNVGRTLSATRFLTCSALTPLR